MDKITYKIYTLGCKVNQYDSAKLAADLSGFGIEEATDVAQIAIINTCAVTMTAIRKNKRLLTKVRNENPGAKIVIMGCWPAVYWDKVKNFTADLIVGTANSKKVVSKIKALFADDILDINFKNKITNKKQQNIEHSRYFIKIQDGCEQFCTYCIIPYTRGKLKSRPEASVIKEIKMAIASGFQEIILSGIHLGLYGRDLTGESNTLTALLKKIIILPGLGRVRLSSIEVNDINSELIDIVATHKNLCPHFHIPLQSGDDKILKAMNRPYDSKYFLQKIKAIRKKNIFAAISTDVIVGFPGESAAEFNNSFNFIQKAGFSRLHVFPFSLHEKTAAAQLKNRVSANDIKLRAKKMRQLDAKLRQAYLEKFQGKKVNVLVEKKFGDYCVGKSEFYFDVKFKKRKNEKLKIGEIYKIICRDKKHETQHKKY